MTNNQSVNNVWPESKSINQGQTNINDEKY